MRTSTSVVTNVTIPPRLSFLALAIFLLFSMATTLRAQSSADETIPDRGFHPSSSYALSNIETINTTNGI